MRIEGLHIEGLTAALKDGMMEPYEPLIKRIAKQAAEQAIASGEVVRIEHNGETVGFMCPDRWVPGDADFKIGAISVKVLKD